MLRMLEAISKRTDWRSVLRPNSRVIEPSPLRDTDDTERQPLILESTPSSRDVTSDSTTREEAPGYENDTLTSREGDDGVYCTLSMENPAAPTMAVTAIRRSTENEDMPRFPSIFRQLDFLRFLYITEYSAGT